MSGINGGWKAAVRHIVCVLALMWTGIVNGQPFFFYDSTNYIRAADAAVFVVSHGRLSTAWSDRYRNHLPAAKAAPAPAPSPTAATLPPAATANDIGSGTIMSGRSPYIGALMYAGYVLGDFWPFVLLQAITAYLLILLVLRRFALDSAAIVTGTVLFIAATTSLPTFASMLLADAFAAFGIVAFALIAMPGRLSRLELAFLVAVVLVSVVSHLTDIVMQVGMLAALAIAGLLRWIPPTPRRAWITGIAAVLIGVISVQVTSYATQKAFGRAPQLLPLLTARFYADGPGKRFIESGCDGNRFETCRIAIGPKTDNAMFLFANEPEYGAYLLTTPDSRRRMGAQDVDFALAVFRHDPVGLVGVMALNTARQLANFRYGGLNMGCFPAPHCWESLPPTVRETLRNSPSGRRTWPDDLMNAIQYVVVIGSLIALALVWRELRRRDPLREVQLRTFAIIAGAAMTVGAFFGGAVADPQYRYQGRMVWMIVLAAIIALLAWRKARGSNPIVTD